MPSDVDTTASDALEVLHSRFGELEQQIRSCVELLGTACQSDAVVAAAAAAAHDLNNILTSVAGYARFAAGRPDDVALAVQALRQCAVGAERGAVMTRSLLDVLAGSRPAAEAESNVSLAIHEAIGLASGQHAGLVVEYLTSSDSSLTVQMDSTSLVRVVQNLLVNAAAAADGPECRVVIRAELLGNSGLSAGGGERGWVRVEVSDDGPGISEAARVGLFRPFARAPGAVGGHGLGLWICKSLVEAAGGCIGVETAAGEGTTFTILLPAAM